MDSRRPTGQRFARAHRQVTQADGDRRRPGAGTFAFYRPDGGFSGTADYIRRYYDENPAA